MTNAPSHYRRDLPHIHPPDKTFFVTFRSYHRWHLPEEARQIALDCCVFVHRKSACLHCAVVMPDHVHLLLTPISDGVGETTPLITILKGIKGTSARRINMALYRRGPVWQSESFDHILRSDESAEAKAEYISMNPVRKGLVSQPEKYKWYWEATDGDML
jgi:REP element-mobilizing transposase RayT